MITFWTKYKISNNLITAEMWKDALEVEGLPTKILPIDNILEWSEFSRLLLWFLKVGNTLLMKY